MDLAVEQQRIEDRPSVIDRSVADQFDLAGVDVDFNLGDMNAVGKAICRAKRRIGRVRRGPALSWRQFDGTKRPWRRRRG